MTNSIDSGIGNALCMQRKLQSKKEIYNYQLSLSIVYENYTYGTILSIAYNKYKIINSNRLSLQFIVFIGINQYLLEIFNEVYLYLFISFINDNYNQCYYMNIFSINNNPLIVNNKLNKSKKNLPFQSGKNCIYYFISNRNYNKNHMLLDNPIWLGYSGLLKDSETENDAKQHINKCKILQANWKQL